MSNLWSTLPATAEAKKGYWSLSINLKVSLCILAAIGTRWSLCRSLLQGSLASRPKANFKIMHKGQRKMSYGNEEWDLCPLDEATNLLALLVSSGIQERPIIKQTSQQWYFGNSLSHKNWIENRFLYTEHALSWGCVACLQAAQAILCPDCQFFWHVLCVRSVFPVSEVCLTDKIRLFCKDMNAWLFSSGGPHDIVCWDPCRCCTWTRTIGLASVKSRSLSGFLL